MTADPLAPLLDLAGVADALAEATAAVAGALRHRALRRAGGTVAAEVGLRSAVASAALEGRTYDPEQVRAGLVIDPVVQGALRVSAELDALAGRWLVAPRQVLARLHVLAATGVVGPAELGRPVPGTDPVRLNALAELVAGGTAVPALVRAAVVHGELLALRPFAGPSGVVARAAARLTLVATGLDPRGLLPVDAGHLARGPEYVGAAGAFATGTPDGVRSWLRHCATATVVATGELRAICDAVCD